MDGSDIPSAVNRDFSYTNPFRHKQSVCPQRWFRLGVGVVSLCGNRKLMVPCRCNPKTVARPLRASYRLVCVGLTLLITSCAGSHSAAVAPSAPTEREAEVDRVIVTSGDASTAFELLQRGRIEFEAGDARAAARSLELVVTQDANGPWVEEALYVGALAHESSGDYVGAATRFERVAQEFHRGEWARDAHLRAVRLYVYLERWSEAASLAQSFLERYAERAPREEIVVHSTLALHVLNSEGHTQAGRDRALTSLTRARSVIDKYQLDGAGNIPRDLAQTYYAKGEHLRLEGESVGFVPMPDNFADHFERRAQLLLDAQSAYSDVMRAYDAHWTAMAGYRVGELYQRLHQDILAIPRPEALETERRRLIFEAALRTRYKVLLEKGLNMMQHTLAMAERTSETSQWVERARQARDDLRAALRDEEAAIQASPYSREDIERVLAELSKRRPKQPGPQVKSEPFDR